MTIISKSATVPFSAEQMYELVNDIEKYPLFLPWCVDAKILSNSNDRLSASLTLALGKIKYTFATENVMQPAQRIDLQLLDGPFKYLNGYWKFDDKNEKKSYVSINMEFEFKNKLVQLTLDKIFTRIISSLIESFTQRAYQIYGRNEKSSIRS